jgi:hypothetical protein
MTSLRARFEFLPVRTSQNPYVDNALWMPVRPYVTTVASLNGYANPDMMCRAVH